VGQGGRRFRRMVFSMLEIAALLDHYAPPVNQVTGAPALEPPRRLASSGSKEETPVSVTALAREAALRYVAMVPMRAIITEHVAKAVDEKGAVPPEHRERVIQRFTDRFVDIVVRIIVSQAVAHFTIGELHALLRFYGSPDGQGVMSKLLPFTRDLEAEVVAAIDAEIRASAPPPA